MHEQCAIFALFELSNPSEIQFRWFNLNIYIRLISLTIILQLQLLKLVLTQTLSQVPSPTSISSPMHLWLEPIAPNKIPNPQFVLYYFLSKPRWYEFLCISFLHPHRPHQLLSVVHQSTTLSSLWWSIYGWRFTGVNSFCECEVNPSKILCSDLLNINYAKTLIYCN